MLVFLLCALMTLYSCERENAYPKVQLLCAWPEDYFSGESVKNQVGEIVLSETPLTQIDSVYVIRINEKIGKLGAGPLAPCNMPSKAQKNGLKIKVSGHIVRFDGFDSALFTYGYPFEITAIEYLN